MLQFAFALSQSMGARFVSWEVSQDAPFLVGKRVAMSLIPRVFAYPFLCIAEDHAFTGGVVAGLRRVWSFFPYLCVLDAHLDLFSSSSLSFPIHRGNFLAYLLEREKFPEDRLLVCSDVAFLRALEEQIATLSPGLLYLSWDIDFGFPEVAHFPGKAVHGCLEDFFTRLALCCRKSNLRFLGGDLVELNPRKVKDPYGLARQVSRCLVPFFMEEECR